jgi:hypothetical protein
LRQRETSKLVKRLTEIGVTKTLGKGAVQKHRYGNRNEWCVEIMFERTLYTPEDGREFIKRWKNGELTPEFRAEVKKGLKLLRQAEALLGLPHSEVTVYW